MFRIILNKQYKHLLNTRQKYWEIMNDPNRVNQQEYYQTRRCELERIINYIFGTEY